MDNSANSKTFTGLVILAQVLGLSAVVLVAVWFSQYAGGFAWSWDPKTQFNYHPLFMIIGFLFLYADAILVYRVFRNQRKTRVKLLHGCLHATAFIFMVVGLKAVWDSHDLNQPKPLANLYSLHSWVGLSTVILFSLQWTIGFISFMFPGLRLTWKQFLMPLHVYFGLVIFAMAIASVISGITEKSMFNMPKTYSTKPPQGILANMLGLVVIAQGIVVGYIVTNGNWKRAPMAEEEHFPIPSPD